MLVVEDPPSERELWRSGHGHMRADSSSSTDEPEFSPHPIQHPSQKLCVRACACHQSSSSFTSRPSATLTVPLQHCHHINGCTGGRYNASTMEAADVRTGFGDQTRKCVMQLAS